MRTRRIQALLVAALTTLALAGVQVAAQAAPPSRSITVSGSHQDEDWTGDLASGANTDYDPAAGEPCEDDNPANVTTYCDKTLLRVNVAPTFWGALTGGVEVTIDGYTPPTDFDLYVYKSNSAGSRGALVGSSAGLPGNPERATFSEPSGYYLIQVVYFAVTAQTYQGHINFFFRHRKPRDVDVPKGLQDVLASNARVGWKSHSEPHIAQNPIDPKILVAGSKFYNMDRDSLKEYEFKIGTFVSFNGGKSWKDLGQLDAGKCPASQSDNQGDDKWPNNVCYPPDKPNLGGTGPEDVKDPDADPPDTLFDNRGTGDYGEEYITSDIWMQFDDEGNAYAMVLDSPPYTGSSGDTPGWGMTVHKWKSVSPLDLKTGKTWSHRHPINAYDDQTKQDLGFLDDKNTMAVNNAGPDKEAEPTNIVITCWGQNVSTAVKQQEVCERSPFTPGGEPGVDWSGEPVPVSGEHQLVIGIHVIADKANPLTFYAVYLGYDTSVGTGNIGGIATLEFVRTDNGGASWSSPTVVGTIDDLPTKFPEQGFRNLSIPIMAVGPDPEGAPLPELYVVVAEYLPSPAPDSDQAELDGTKKQADIVMFKSTTGGATWDPPINITQFTGQPQGFPVNPNADQFQPYIDVTESGQLNVVYFDRRHDLKDGDHPGNYFVDTYLSRSNNDGETWSHIRLSHDFTDPEFNAPISGSGRFFGDYQGLVVNDCRAIPFVNDTHLANDRYLDPGPARDPAADRKTRSLPFVKYQQAINWRVPNIAKFGGNGKPDLKPTAISSSDKPPRKGDPTTLRARIRNLSCIGTRNVVVQFLDNGKPIGSTKISLMRGNTTKFASVGWTPPSRGAHTITAVVDPGQKINEKDEANNTKTRAYNVQ